MYNRITILISFFFLMGCEEILEVEDISNETIHVLAPVNNTTLNNTTVNFNWQPLDSAESYQLQIANPNFENANVIVLDTIIGTTNYTQSLEQGNYQWRIRATNFAYNSVYSTQNLSIEE